MLVNNPYTQTASDSELAGRARNGEIEVFDELVRRSLQPLYAFVRRLIGGDPADADDVVQESFIKAFRHLRRYDPARPWRTWLYTIARNSAIDWMRTHRTIAFSHIDTDDREPFGDRIPDEQPLPDELLRRGQLTQEVEALLEELSPDSRSILLLHYVDGFPFEEIARTLGMPAATVRSRHHRALATLRRQLIATESDFSS